MEDFGTIHPFALRDGASFGTLMHVIVSVMKRGVFFPFPIWMKVAQVCGPETFCTCVVDQVGTANAEEAEDSAEEDQEVEGGPTLQSVADHLLQRAAATLPRNDSQSDGSIPAVQTQIASPYPPHLPRLQTVVT
ncbi:UNVERIFIED_CONTAM: hypothetical protein K2H54_051586 [Gekko kuhli]